MGYRIDYKTVVRERRPKKRHHPILLLSICLLAILLLNTVLKDQRALMLKAIFPGDVEITMVSLDNMLTQLKSGAPFQEAFLCFCQQVIAG